MTLYSLALRLHNKQVSVIGGGTIATRKIKSLLKAGAKVHVTSPSVTVAIEHWAREKKLILSRKNYDSSAIEDAFIIIAATNNRGVNLQVLHDKKNYQLINIVDLPEKSDFFVPAVIERGKFVITVSTTGASPGLAKRIKNELMTTYDETYEAYVHFLDTCRKYVMEHIKEEWKRKQVLVELLDPKFLSLTKEKKIKQREELFIELVNRVKEE